MRVPQQCTTHSDSGTHSFINYENILSKKTTTLLSWKFGSNFQYIFKTLCTSGAWVESSCYLISPESISLRNLWHLAMRILMASVTRTSGARMPVDSTETGGEEDAVKGWVVGQWKPKAVTSSSHVSKLSSLTKANNACVGHKSATCKRKMWFFRPQHSYFEVTAVTWIVSQ